VIASYGGVVCLASVAMGFITMNDAFLFLLSVELIKDVDFHNCCLQVNKELAG